MTLAAAIAQWLETTARDGSVSQAQAEAHALSLTLLARYFGENARLGQVTPARLRDFLARWFIENGGPAPHRSDPNSSQADFPDPVALTDTLAAFVEWAAGSAALPAECLAVIAELRERLPRAIAIGARLSAELAGRGGAFGFPEFLTSFEAGGHSEYDFGGAGEQQCLEGYFRIARVEGGHVEAQELLTETAVSPVLFPAAVAALLERDYIINLELIHARDAWQVVACGFAYPPGTEV
jgi:hypothetical protein